MRVAVGLAGLSILLVGCAGPVDGTAEPVGKTTGEPVFSPCDDIPDEAVRAIGLDPATEARDIMDVHQPGWSICEWNDDAQSLAVLSTIYTLDDIRGNDQYTDFSDIEVGGRKSLMYLDVTDREGAVCDVAVASSGGAVMFSIFQSGSEPAGEEACTTARAMAEVLMPYIPE